MVPFYKIASTGLSASKLTASSKNAHVSHRKSGTPSRCLNIDCRSGRNLVALHWRNRQWQTCDRLVKKKKEEITKIIISPSSQIALQKRPEWNEIETCKEAHTSGCHTPYCSTGIKTQPGLLMAEWTDSVDPQKRSLTQLMLQSSPTTSLITQFPFYCLN